MSVCVEIRCKVGARRVEVSGWGGGTERLTLRSGSSLLIALLPGMKPL